jgi:predicted Zn-dependent protease
MLLPRGLALVLAITLVSVPEEIEIGKQSDAQVRKQVPELRDAQTTAYVRAIGQQLTRHAPGPKYPYRFAVADYREINAFALPGGPVWVHRGVLQSATSESQVAGVLAHEIAHVAQRHAADQLTKAMIANWGLTVLGAVLGNTGGAGTTQVAASLLANGVFLKFSRDDEREADDVGLQIMRRAGWDPQGMIELFEILRREQRRDPGSVETFFSSHPSAQDRIARLRAAMPAARAGRRDSRQFQALRTHLTRLPAAKAMPRG